MEEIAELDKEMSELSRPQRGQRIGLRWARRQRRVEAPTCCLDPLDELDRSLTVRMQRQVGQELEQELRGPLCRKARV